MNRIQIIGNLGFDPEIQTSQAGNKYAKISVATNRRWKDGEGETQEETTWHRVTVFGGWNVRILELAAKGDRVFVEGRMEFDRVSEEDGGKGYWPVCIARIVNLCEMPPKSGGHQKDAARADEHAQSRPAPRPQKPLNEPDDDLPF